MARFLIRIGQAAFVLWAAFTLSYALLFLLPSDAVEIMLNASGDQRQLNPAVYEALRTQYGLDLPVWKQYLHALGRALQGDLGQSIPMGRPVVGLIAEALPHTLLVGAVAFAMALVIGFTIAIAAALLPPGLGRRGLLLLPPLLVSIPTFWGGLLLIQIFSFGLRWFPATGNRGFVSVVLPALTLAIPVGATIAQLVSKNVQQAWHDPFVMTVRLKGARRPYILFRHVLHYAALPSFTLLALTIGNLLAGAIVVETVFSRPGIGRLAEEAVQSQDIPMIQGLVLLSATVFVTVNLIVELIYPLLDPRLARERTGA
ncbi:ABC transporter permease [Rhizobium puerariae]|uniref:ABC transporter permease n=1 Tax=Rhizobium puerariae TaxID=1585791 RepID=A0ABV6ADJ5_9HYPH